MVWTPEQITRTLLQNVYRGKGGPVLQRDDAESINRCSPRQRIISDRIAPAIEAAGIDYAGVLRRPRWTRAGIIAVLKKG